MTHVGLELLRKWVPNTPNRRRLVINLCDELAVFGTLSLATIEKEMMTIGVILPPSSKDEVLEKIQDFIKSI